MTAGTHGRSGTARRTADGRWRPLLVAFVLIALAALPGTVAAQGSPEDGVVRGTVTTSNPVTLSSAAVLVVTLLDRDARGGSGAIVGMRRVAASGTTPLKYAVAFDPARIDPSHSYLAFAALIDGTTTRQSGAGIPVITGGPVSGVAIRVAKMTAFPATVSGTISTKDRSTVGEKAVAYAALIDTASGRTVAWTLRTPSGQVPVPFAIGYDPELVAPDAALAVWTAIVDGRKVGESGLVPVAGDPATGVEAGDLVVSGRPAVPPLPTPAPTPTPAPVTIPDVRGTPEESAVRALTGAGLSVASTIRAWNASVPKGSATKTVPGAGTVVATGTGIELHLSKGPKPTPTPVPTPKPTAKPTATPATTARPTATPVPTVKIPAIDGLPEADAIARLNDAGLLVGARERRTNASVPAGSVIRAEPPAGTVVARGSKVSLYLSTGPAPTPTPVPVKVPDVRGLVEADAIVALADRGFTIGERPRRTDPTVAAGTVLVTDPAAGKKAPKGTAVTIVVSAGPEATPTPAPTPSPSATPGPDASPGPADAFLTGLLVYPEPAVPGEGREIVVTLVETSELGARVIPTEVFVQEGSSPPAFALAYRSSDIDPARSYRLLAGIADGPDAWLTADGVPVITGGAATYGIVVPLTYRAALEEGTVAGAIIGAPAALSDQAVLQVFIVRGDSGAIVGYEAGPAEARGSAIVFSVPYQLEAIDPAVPYLVVARVADGASTWTGPGVPVLTQGAGFRVVVPVAAAGDPSAPLVAPAG